MQKPGNITLTNTRDGGATRAHQKVTEILLKPKCHRVAFYISRN